MNANEAATKFSINDYELMRTYSRIDECTEALKVYENFGERSDMAIPHSEKATGKIWFSTKKDGFTPMYYATNNDGEFQMYELTYEAYCRYEQELRN